MAQFYSIGTERDMTGTPSLGLRFRMALPATRPMHHEKALQKLRQAAGPDAGRLQARQVDVSDEAATVPV